MANNFSYGDKKFRIGDSIRIAYKVKEGDKERQQNFDGILIGIRGGQPENKTITVRRISKSGIGIERIFPHLSPWIIDIKLKKSGSYNKSSAYFIRNLSEKEMKKKLFKTKKITKSRGKNK
jgi:large subunit ribosomal protein L19